MPKKIKRKVKKSAKQIKCERRIAAIYDAKYWQELTLKKMAAGKIKEAKELDDKATALRITQLKWFDILARAGAEKTHKMLVDDGLIPATHTKEENDRSDV